MGEGPDGAVSLSETEGHIQRRGPFPDLQQRGVAAEEGGHVLFVGREDNLPHRPSAGEHGIQISVQKGLQSPLSSAGADGAEEVVHSLLRGGVGSSDADAAGEPDELQNGGVHNGNRLPDTAVKGHLSISQGHIAVQCAEGVALAVPELCLNSFGDRRLFFAVKPTQSWVPPFF